MLKPQKRGADPADAPTRAVIYTRVSTAEQADSGAGLVAQETGLRADAARRGWQVVAHLTDAGASGKSLAGRPALAEALRLVSEDKADVLAVAKLDRLSRSLLDFAGLMAQAQAEGWSLVALDLAVDMTTPSGRLIANVMASVAEWERETIAARTRDSLAVKRAQGVVLGRPVSISDEAVGRARALRDSGLTLAACAEQLTAEGVPTAQNGARWYASTVRQVLISSARRERERANAEARTPLISVQGTR
jgi:DNA invertase Pin-like site-specific DNA recombinase